MFSIIYLVSAIILCSTNLSIKYTCYKFIHVYEYVHIPNQISVRILINKLLDFMKQ